MNAKPVLVVDDDQAIRDLVADALRDEGYAVLTAADGAEALGVVSETEPAVVLLDMRMPVMDGWGFARAIHERGVEVPIIVMTAAENAQRWCDEIAGDDCLPKPFDIDQLFSIVARLTSTRTSA